MKQKLELTWIGKDQRPRLEPRIWLEDPARSCHAGHRVTENDLFDNRLIKGDNLLVMKALEADFTGKEKCVSIEPPYNTGSTVTHYDDGLEQSIWMGLMRDRREIIRRLASEDGSLWITIDDNKAACLKVCCAAYRGMTPSQAVNRWPNFTIKKVPKMVKDRCEWGHDDDSLNVSNLPMAQRPAVAMAAQDDLFGGDGA